jgi:hypothetical protein
MDNSLRYPNVIQFGGSVVKFENLGILFLVLLQTVLVPYTTVYVLLALFGFQQSAYLYINGFEDFPLPVLMALLIGSWLMIYGACQGWRELLNEE